MKAMARAALLAAALVAALAVAPATPAQGDRITLEEAVSLVQERTDGRVLSAREVRGEDGTVYQVRVLVKPGHVRVFEVDAHTGRVR